MKDAEQQKQDARAEQGIKRMRMIHHLEAEGVVERADAWDRNEAMQDPTQSLPRPRSDLPKNGSHESIHNP